MSEPHEILFELEEQLTHIRDLARALSVMAGEMSDKWQSSAFQAVISEIMWTAEQAEERRQIAWRRLRRTPSGARPVLVHDGEAPVA